MAEYILELKDFNSDIGIFPDSPKYPISSPSISNDLQREISQLCYMTQIIGLFHIQYIICGKYNKDIGCCKLNAHASHQKIMCWIPNP
jgi:hypothetical protein